MLWPRVRQTVDTATGEVQSTAYLNVKHGPSLTLHKGGLLVERSLPKLLHDQNITDLEPGEVGAALAALDAEIADVLPGVTLPSVDGWEPARVDYCRSVALGDEAKVMRALDRYADMALPYKGLPVRGQHYGVRWPVGRVQPKFYDKFLETKGDPRAYGVLRQEASVYRLATFRKVLGVPSPLMRDALTSAAHEAVWAPFGEYLRGGVMSEEEMGDLRFVRELVGFFGTRRAAALVGYCVLFALAGCKTRQDMLGSDILEFRTKYRVLADIRAFRSAMAAKGYAIGEDDAEAVLMVARLQRAAA